MESRLQQDVVDLLKAQGASLVGFADLGGLPENARRGFPRAVSFAVALDKRVIQGIGEGPTHEYHAEYKRANSLLAEMSRDTAQFLRDRGHRAEDSTTTYEGFDVATYSSVLPHKTAATLAGLGWIGKCALLVTEQHGPAVRLNRVLTDAPFETASPVVESRCGPCTLCADACPGHAIKGVEWKQGMARDRLYDALACLAAARRIAKARIGVEESICGICIAACPRFRSGC